MLILRKSKVVNLAFVVGTCVILIWHFIFLIVALGQGRVSFFSDGIGRALGMFLLFIAAVFSFRISLSAMRSASIFLVTCFLYASGIIISGPDADSIVFVLLSFCLYVLAPFLLIISAHITEKHVLILKDSLLISHLLFSCLVIYFSAELIGAGRLANEEQGGLITPLVVSYLSAAMIGILFHSLAQPGKSLRYTMFLLVLMVPYGISFGLGASRGSVIALLCGVLFQLALISPRLYLRFFVGLLVLLVFFGVLASYGYFDVLLGRVTQTLDGSGRSVGLRESFWMTAFNKILDNPIGFSYYILPEHNIYVHNIYLEAAMVGSVFCFLFFSLFILMVLRKAYRLAIWAPATGWLGIVFVQSLVRYAFSHTFFTSYAIAIFSAIIISAYSSFRNERHFVRAYPIWLKKK